MWHLARADARANDPQASGSHQMLPSQIGASTGTSVNSSSSFMTMTPVCGCTNSSSSSSHASSSQGLDAARSSSSCATQTGPRAPPPSMLDSHVQLANSIGSSMPSSSWSSSAGLQNQGALTSLPFTQGVLTLDGGVREPDSPKLHQGCGSSDQTGRGTDPSCMLLRLRC